jgi:hypothetical protein
VALVGLVVITSSRRGYGRRPGQGSALKQRFERWPVQHDQGKDAKNGTDGETQEGDDRQDKTEPVCSLVFPVFSAGYDSGSQIAGKSSILLEMDACPGQPPAFGSETASNRTICCKQFALKRLIA